MSEKSELVGDLAHLIDEAVGTYPELADKIVHMVAAAAEKTAQHVEENWQDQKSAKSWWKISDVLRKAADKIEGMYPF